MKILSIGSDPEFFVLDPKGKPFPATAFARGTKDTPVAIAELGDGYFEQRDNVSFEGNIPPAYTREEFVSNMTKLRNYFLNKVTKFRYSLSSNGVEYFAKRYLETAEANEFGCSSVVDSWGSSTSRSYYATRATPVLSKVKYRVSGFHIHIGYDTDHNPFNNKKDTDILLGRLFDVFLTIPSHEMKPEPERIESYGRWGMIRMKDYGVECRTLSSFFTQPEYLGWVWDQVMKMEHFINRSSKEDLTSFSSTPAFLGSTVEDAKQVLSVRFKNFKNKEVLKLYKETNF